MSRSSSNICASSCSSRTNHTCTLVFTMARGEGKEQSLVLVLDEKVERVRKHVGQRHSQHGRREGFQVGGAPVEGLRKTVPERMVLCACNSIEFSPSCRKGSSAVRTQMFLSIQASTVERIGSHHRRDGGRHACDRVDKHVLGSRCRG